MNLIEFYSDYEEKTGHVGAFYEEIFDPTLLKATREEDLDSYENGSLVNIWYEAFNEMQLGRNICYVDTQNLENKVLCAIVRVAELLNVYVDYPAYYSGHGIELDFSEEYR